VSVLGMCVLVACCTPPAHTILRTVTKDTIYCICEEIVTSIAPEDGRKSPKHVELKEHKLILNCIKLVNYFIFQNKMQGKTIQIKSGYNLII